MLKLRITSLLISFLIISCQEEPKKNISTVSVEIINNETIDSLIIYNKENSWEILSCLRFKNSNIMKIVAGVDEVGRGSLIGPVYAAAVILDISINKKLLKDSKTITKNKRQLLSNYIKKNSIWAIGKASVKEIEKINILQASLLAMKRAIKKLKKKPSHVLIDGNKIPDLENYNLIFRA